MDEEYYLMSRDYGGHKIDCHSALGLLGLLGLLEILRDLLNDLTDLRKKRSIPSHLKLWSAWQQVKQNLPEDVIITLPTIIMPLMEVIVDVNDEIQPPSCLDFQFCEANRRFMDLPLNFTWLNHVIPNFKKDRRWKIEKENYRKKLRNTLVPTNNSDFLLKNYNFIDAMKPHYKQVHLNDTFQTLLSSKIDQDDFQKHENNYEYKNQHESRNASTSKKLSYSSKNFNNFNEYATKHKISQLATEVIGKTFIPSAALLLEVNDGQRRNGDLVGNLYERAMQAAAIGRQEHQCSKFYHECPRLNDK